jgi:hypothetical protein
LRFFSVFNNKWIDLIVKLHHLNWIKNQVEQVWGNWQRSSRYVSLDSRVNCCCRTRALQSAKLLLSDKAWQSDKNLPPDSVYPLTRFTVVARLPAINGGYNSPPY